MKMVSVDIVVSRLIGSTKPEHIHCNGAVACTGERRDHLAKKIGPARFAMDAQKCRLGICRPLVNIMHPQAVITRQVLHILRWERPARKVFKPVFRGAERVYYHVMLSFFRRQETLGERQCKTKGGTHVTLHS